MTVTSRPATRVDLDLWLMQGGRILWHYCNHRIRWNGEKAICDGCNVAWSLTVLSALRDRDMAERFHVLMTTPEFGVDRLVWITTNGTEHAGMIAGSVLEDVRGTLVDGRAWRAWDL